MGWAHDGSLLALGGHDGLGGRLEIWNDRGHHQGHHVRHLTHAIDSIAPTIWQLNLDLPHFLD